MAEETYGIQESIKSGDDMLNIRGADSDEFLQIYTDLLEAADDNEIAAGLVEKYGLGEAKPKPKPRSRSTSSTSRSSSRSSGSRRSSGGGGGMKDPDGEPSEKQLDFAKQLKIRGATKMTKAELSEAIDEALAKRDEDDDDD